MDRMPLTVENDEAAYPGYIALFGLEGVVLSPQDRTGLFENSLRG
jgi:hypothetical protein